MADLESYLEILYKQTLPASLSVEERKRMLLEKLGNFTYSPKLERAVLEESLDQGEYIQERWNFLSSENMTIPMYILTPKPVRGKLPAVLSIHGHGKGTQEALDSSVESPHHHFAVKLVRKGMKVFVPEVIGFGGRRLEKHKLSDNQNSCYTLATHLLAAGKTLAGLRTFEARLALDLIYQNKGVDSNRIGIFGFSGGGLIASLTSILDSRIRATVLSGFTSTFQGSILAEEHCIDNYIPGLLQVGELPELIGLIAPRPLFVEGGTKDDCFPIASMKESIRKIKPFYKERDDQFSYDIFEGKHEIRGRKAFDWLYSKLTGS